MTTRSKLSRMKRQLLDEQQSWPAKATRVEHCRARKQRCDDRYAEVLRRPLRPLVGMDVKHRRLVVLYRELRETRAMNRYHEAAIMLEIETIRAGGAVK